jgi:hypothetical protein
VLLTILIVLLVLSLFGGGFSYPRYGYGSFGPLGAVLLVILLLYLLGALR